MSIKVFYAWQSDQAKRVNRHFISDAIKAAIKKLNVDARVKSAPSFGLDHDVKGEPGTPPIARTIARKIKNCGIFVADVTFVTDYRTHDGDSKRIPNANVLIELGMATRRPGWRRILLIMNTAFGEPQDLPFDLKEHSFPIQYELAEDADAETKKRVKSSLVAALAHKLSDIFVEMAEVGAIQSAEQQRQLALAAKARLDEVWAPFVQGLSGSDFHRMEAIFCARRIQDADRPKTTIRIGLAIVPHCPPSSRLDIATVKQARQAELPPPGTDYRTHGCEAYGRFVVCHNGGRSEPPNSVAELRDEGVALAAFDQGLFRISTGHLAFHMQETEMSLLRAISSYTKLLRSLGVSGSLETRVVVVGAKGVLPIPDSLPLYRSAIRCIKEEELPSESAVLSDEVDGSSVRDVAQAMRQLFAVIWMDAGYPGDPTFSNAGEFRGGK